MIDWASPAGWLLMTVGQILAMLVWILISLAFLLWGDRKVWAGVQMRKGPCFRWILPVRQCSRGRASTRAAQLPWPALPATSAARHLQKRGAKRLIARHLKYC